MFSEKFIAKIREIYEKRERYAPELFQEIDKKIKTCGEEEQILLCYLYGNMPLSDMMNYPFETFFDYARHGVFLWEKGLFKGRVSEEMFCQYVVYHRINTEDISPCRSFFYEKVKAEAGFGIDAVTEENIAEVNTSEENTSEVSAGKMMTEVVLALNYWCAQEVTYRASDDRTASPMTTYRSAHGRCGEESTFTVSVLRSMGIPARQVYAPRWSHCDDNHAWVEAWCDGEWHFLGACEPEEILDKGWFLHASSRAMLIHSRWYGSLELAGDTVDAEDIVATQGMTTEINEIGTYANTRRVKIKVQDSEGQVVDGAQVRIEVLNYSEFFPIATLTTNADGTAEIELGLGTCRVYGRKQDKEGSHMLDVRECRELTLVLGETDNCQTFENFAPQDAVIHSGFVTEEQRMRQKEKLAERTAIRLKKTGTGNEAEVEKFLGKLVNVETAGTDRKNLLDTLTEKDFLDLRADVLETHLCHAMQYKGQFSDEVFQHYILAPRIYLEVLTDYRSEIDELLTNEQKQSFRQNPEEIWEYIAAYTKEYPEEEYDALLTFPGACLKYAAGSRQSQEVLFVAVCRTLGIPARLNPVDGAMEYYKADIDGFVKVIEPETCGKLRIYSDSSENFVYFQNWSVTRKQPGMRKLLDLSNIKADEGADIVLPAGTYEIITANRLPNGNILGCIKEVTIEPGSTAAVELELEEAELSQMLECVPMPPFEVSDSKGEKQHITEIMKGKPNLVIWLSEGQEPTEHILNELYERAEEFNQGNTGIIFLVDCEKSLEQPTLKRTLQQLGGVRIFYDNVEERVSVLGRRFYVDPESIPLILVADKDANCVYATSGYNVGTADMILKIFGAGI